MNVVQFMRKPVDAYSVERIFEDIRPLLSSDIKVSVYVNPYRSKGVWRRAAGMVRAAIFQGDINHITGDVHFLNIMMRKRSTILTVLDCVSLERLTGIRYWIYWFFWYWLPAKKSTAITVISESARRELERHLGAGHWPITVIPCPVSIEFNFSQKVADWNCPRILQVGTTANKNLERVAAALEGMQCKLVVIGNLASAQLKALTIHRINFENYVGLSREALVDEYRNSDIVILASLYEGFGLPILEAQATGRPVITSNLYSMPEVGGDGACYVDPHSTNDIRNAIKLIASDSVYRDRLISAGLENVKKYTPSTIAEKYTQLYREVYMGGVK